MNFYRVIIVFFVLITVTACATKRYPIATSISPAETELMTCADFELEILRADQIEQKINQTGDFDGKTILGFLGDFGIGNAMAKDEARVAISERRITINEARVKKGCTQAAMVGQSQPAGSK
jgi:hypothetical protein